LASVLWLQSEHTKEAAIQAAFVDKQTTSLYQLEGWALELSRDFWPDKASLRDFCAIFAAANRRKSSPTIEKTREAACGLQ
jgi:hypothetical protein